MKRVNYKNDLKIILNTKIAFQKFKLEKYLYFSKILVFFKNTSLIFLISSLLLPQIQSSEIHTSCS